MIFVWQKATIFIYFSYIVKLLSINTHNTMGRPPTKPARLRNGFYIEVKSQGSSAILIRRDTREQMLVAAEDYARTKNVTIKGEMRNDKWIAE
ncbi:MAG: hypothetical protein RIS89_69 [Bacteroidota bacterium]|jgi:hypothetical protein